MAGDDLFAGAAEERLTERAPLAARLRPKTLDQIIGQQHLVGPGAPLRALVEADRLTSAILWGPPGTGKTTLASVVASETAKRFVPLSAVSAGVRDVREVVEGARRLLGEQGRGTILFLDEVHRFNRAQQDALLPSVEEGLIVLIGATTENPFFEVNAPLLSRSTLWRLEPLSLDELAAVVARGLEAEGATATPEAIEALTGLADGDARAALTTLEVAVALAGDGPVTVDEVERARHSRLHHYGESAHYDYISAFIKSVRGSDPDAGLYWLAQMLESGEDARFVARRLVILASEDIGEADPLALVVADAAARAVEFVGLPEAQLNLAQAVVHLACCTQVQPGDGGPRTGPGRCTPGSPGGRSHPPARRPLPQRFVHRPRRGVRVPPRSAGGVGGPGVPPGRGGRPPLLRAHRPGPRGGPGPATGRLARRRRSRSARTAGAEADSGTRVLPSPCRAAAGGPGAPLPSLTSGKNEPMTTRRGKGVGRHGRRRLSRWPPVRAALATGAACLVVLGVVGPVFGSSPPVAGAAVAPAKVRLSGSAPLCPRGRRSSGPPRARPRWMPKCLWNRGIRPPSRPSSMQCPPPGHRSTATTWPRASSGRCSGPRRPRWPRCGPGWARSGSTWGPHRPTACSSR